MGPMDDKQALNQVSSHYLNQSWQIYMQLYSITKLQWVTDVHVKEENVSILIHYSDVPVYDGITNHWEFDFLFKHLFKLTIIGPLGREIHCWPVGLLYQGPVI